MSDNDFRPRVLPHAVEWWNVALGMSYYKNIFVQQETFFAPVKSRLKRNRKKRRLAFTRAWRKL